MSQQTWSIKGWVVNILGFVSHLVSVATARVSGSHCGAKATGALL